MHEPHDYHQQYLSGAKNANVYFGQWIPGVPTLMPPRRSPKPQ